MLIGRAGRNGVVVAAAAATAVCVLAGAASASVSPDQLFSSALAAANAQRSVHYVATSSSPTVNVRMVGDAGLDRGIQKITYRKGGETGQVTVLVVADTAYVRGDAFALANYMGFSAASADGFAGRWLQIPKTASGYATVAAGVRLKSTLAELVLPRPRLALPETMLHGQRVVGIRHTSKTSGQPVTDTVYLRVASPTLPVAEVASKGPNRFNVTLSNWNKPITVSPPENATPLA